MAHIILTGATGAIGSVVLEHCIASSSISSISVLSRRPMDDLFSNPKVNVILVHDFITYTPQTLQHLRNATGCIWALGKSSTGMEESEYTRITHDYAMAAAKAFGRGSLSNHVNFVYISGEGADPTGKSLQMFGRVKGRTENDLLAISQSDASLSVYNLRPACVDTSANYRAARLRSRMEVAFGFLYLVLKRIALQYYIDVDRLAEVAVKIATGDGKPIDQEDVEAGGRTIRNVAIKRM